MVTSTARVKKEVQECLKDSTLSSCGIKIELVDDNFTRLRGEVVGPDGTPYHGGNFRLSIEIPNTYPFTPPKVRFDTRIWHPNISSQTGAICLDILKDQWAAAMTLRTVLLSIQALMQSPEPDDPQDAFVANQYKSNRALFTQTAKNWTDMYAKGTPDPTKDPKVKQLVEMGFDVAKCVDALAKTGGDVERAIESLFS
eukprot:Opistho-2@54529